MTELGGDLDQLAELIRIESVSSDGAHPAELREAAEWIARLVGGDGAVIEGFGNPLVDGLIPASREGAPTVVAYGHYDVQAAGDLSLWESPPFQPELRDGWLFGRGVVGRQGQLLGAASLRARPGRGRRAGRERARDRRRRGGDRRPLGAPLPRLAGRPLRRRRDLRRHHGRPELPGGDDGAARPGRLPAAAGVEPARAALRASTAAPRPTRCTTCWRCCRPWPATTPTSPTAWRRSPPPNARAGRRCLPAPICWPPPAPPPPTTRPPVSSTSAHGSGRR